MRTFRLSVTEAKGTRRTNPFTGDELPLELGENVARLWIAQDYQRVAAVFTTSDGDRLSVGCWEDVAANPIWQADLFTLDGEVCGEPEFSPDLRWVVSQIGECDSDAFDGKLFVLPVTATAKPQYSLGNNTTAIVPELPTFSGDARFLYARTYNMTRRLHQIRRWDGPALFRACGQKRAKGGFARSPVSSWAIPLNLRGSNFPRSLAISPDDRFLAWGSNKGSVSVSNLVSRRTVVVLSAPKVRPQRRVHAQQLAFAPNGSHLAILRARWVNHSERRELTLCEPKRGATEHNLKEAGSVNGIAFSADGMRLFTACDDGSVGVWDVAKLKKLREYRWNIGKLFCIVVAPDGLTCAAGGENRQVVVWDVDS